MGDVATIPLFFHETFEYFEKSVILSFSVTRFDKNCHQRTGVTS